MSKNKTATSKLWKRGMSIATAGTLFLSMMPLFPLSASAETQKESLLKAGSIPASKEHVTKGGPFPPKTANSDHFRIPAISTLENGSLIAVADARYDVLSGDGSSPDGGGLDTIASVSDDGGKTWHYSFPIYFPDSRQNAGNRATTIIDPGVIVGPDNTIYCIADVNPTGVTTMGGYRSPGCGTGYVEVHGEGDFRLALTADFQTKAKTRPDADGADYEYYVGDFTDGFAPVLNMQDDSPSDYCVDEWYNLYSTDSSGARTELTQTQVDSDTQIQQNVFFEGSDLHVYETGYLWMVSSKDNGLTWDNPTILNTQIKRSDDPNDQALLVSPGKGITTSCGDLVIGFYNWKPGREAASITYSTDNGATWQRTQDMETVEGTEIDTSSENEIVELSDGTLRMFFRHGGYRAAVGNLCYVDATKQPDGSYQLGTAVQTDIPVHKGCNLSALSYSKKIDGKQVILVSAPSDVRANGQILTLVVNDDEEKTLTCKNRFAVPGGQGGYESFVYSCLTELEDGSIGLLWEPNHKSILYSRFAMDEACTPSPFSTGTDVEIEKDEVYTQPNYSGEQRITTQPDETIATAAFSEGTSLVMHDHKGAASDSFQTAFSDTPNANLAIENAEFTFTEGSADGTWNIKNEFANVYLSNGSNTFDTFFTSGAADITVAPGSGENTFRISNTARGRYLIFYYKQTNFNAMDSYNSGSDFQYDLVLLEKDPDASDGALLGYKQAASIVAGQKYLIACLDSDNRAAILYPQGSNFYQVTKMAGSGSSSTVLSITGIGEGYTTAVIDGTTYNIHVTEEHPEPDPDCSHSETVLKNEKEPDCESGGYTGDTICVLCHAILETGSDIPGGHAWGSGTIRTEVTRDNDGLKEYVCQRNPSHKKTQILYSSAYSAFLDVYEELSSTIEDWKANAGLYEENKAFQEACEKAEQLAETKDASRSEMYQIKDDLQKAKESLTVKSSQELKTQLDTAVSTAKQDADKGQDKDIPDEIWNPFQTAYQNAAKELPDGMTEEETSRYLYGLIQTLTKAQEALDEKKADVLIAVKQTLTDALKKAEPLYKKGAAAYTASTWTAFQSAYEKASKAASNADAAELRLLTEQLKAAQSNLKEASAQTPPPANNDVSSVSKATYNGIEYEILDASKMTASVVTLVNKNASKVKISDTVSIGQSKYKVVQINANAFKGAKNLKSAVIGKYITKINKNAFFKCQKLNKVTFRGSSVKTIANGAFKKTKSKITVKVPKNLKKSKRLALKKKLTKAGMSKKLKIS